MGEQQQFLEVVDRDVAEQRFQAAISRRPVGEERVALSEALGRVLSRDVISQVDVPSFDRSNFDGFAVQAADTFGAQEEQPRRLKLLAEIGSTGITPQSQVHRGQAMEIATGGMLPRGADAIVMVEYTNLENQQISIDRSTNPGFGVTFAGADIAQGEVVLRRGDLLTSRDTGVLAAIGEHQAWVWRRPIVAVISTGDEIVAPGEKMRPGLVYDSNARAIADAVRELGALPREMGIVRDDLDELRRRIVSALENCDAVLLSGGTSKGAGDLSFQVVYELSNPGVVAHGVALKPGKPICLAVSDGKPVVVLPGFPTSAVFTFHEFVAPVLRRLAGRPAEERAVVDARLAVKVNSQIGRKEYVLVGLTAGAADDSQLQYSAFPMGKGSGSVTAFSRADGFVSVDRHQEIVEAGTVVSVQLMGRDLRMADLVVIGSHCIGLDMLLGRSQDQGFNAKFLAVGSMGGLDAVKRGECDLAPVHLLDPQTGIYNRPFLTSELELIPGYVREQGFVYRPGDTRFEEKTAQQAIQAAALDESCMMVNRNQGSGTRILIDRLLENARPAGYAVQAHNHNAVAAAVLQGRADWGVTIAPVARRAGLAFLPLTGEHFDFVVPNSRIGRPAVAAFRDLLKDQATLDELSKLGFLTNEPPS